MELTINTSLLSAYHIILALQLAVKHPDFGPIAEQLETFGRDLGENLKFGNEMKKAIADNW